MNHTNFHPGNCIVVFEDGTTRWIREYAHVKYIITKLEFINLNNPINSIWRVKEIKTRTVEFSIERGVVDRDGDMIAVDANIKYNLARCVTFPHTPFPFPPHRDEITEQSIGFPFDENMLIPINESMMKKIIELGLLGTPCKKYF